MSTLSVHLEPFGVAPVGGAAGFLGGLGTGWRALVTALGAAVVVLGVLLPWLGVAALVAAGVLVPIRLARRRATVGAPVPAAPPQEEADPGGLGHRPTTGRATGGRAGRAAVCEAPGSRAGPRR